MAIRPDKNFRENPERSVFITQDIDAQLVNRITPEITRLRLTSDDPICLYIDSYGGNVYSAEKLLRLIKSPNQNDRVPHLITVAVGNAASAAADLLAVGDYAIAYPQAQIHYHGARQSGAAVTLEDVPTLATNLRDLKEHFALRLASRMFRRMVLHMVSFSAHTNSDGWFRSSVTQPEEFFKKLTEKVSPPQKEVLQEASKRQKKIAELVKFAEQRRKSAPEKTGIQLESELLKGIIDFEVTQLANQTNFSVANLNTIQEDFIQLNDFFGGRYRQNLTDIVSEFGLTFLSTEEAKNYSQIPGRDIDGQKQFLLATVAPLLNPLWYLIVSVSRLLQEGEHPLPVIDAYWLGLVDEVVGSGLTCFRMLREFVPETPQTPEAPNETSGAG